MRSTIQSANPEPRSGAFHFDALIVVKVGGHAPERGFFVSWWIMPDGKLSLTWDDILKIAERLGIPREDAIALCEVMLPLGVTRHTPDDEVAT